MTTSESSGSKLNDGFDQPQQVTDLQIVFPASLDGLLPAYDDIPLDFRRNVGEAHKWVRFQQDWFFEGISREVLTPREDVDMDAALRHLKVIQGSFEPKHEHKEAAVAWLASRWFADVRAGGR